METQTTHIDRTQKSLAMLAIMRRIEEKRKKRPRRRTPEVDIRTAPEMDRPYLLVEAVEALPLFSST